MQLVTAIALGKAGPVLDADQLQAHLDTLEKLSQKSKSHGVKREVRGSVEGLVQTALAMGLVIPSAHAQRAWWKRLPEPIRRTSEWVTRPGFSRTPKDGAQRAPDQNRASAFPLGRWKGEWLWWGPRQALHRAAIELIFEGPERTIPAPASVAGKLKWTPRAEVSTETRASALEFTVTWQRDSQQLRMALPGSAPTALATHFPTVWQDWTTSQNSVVLRAENGQGVGLLIEASSTQLRSQ